jgi:hypothetical protein
MRGVSRRSSSATNELAACRGRFGEHHPHTLAAAVNLATNLRNLGEYSAPPELNQPNHQTFPERFGEDDPHTLAALNNLAVNLRLIGEYNAPTEPGRPNRQTNLEQFGEHHPHTLTAGDRPAGATLVGRREYRTSGRRHSPASRRTRRRPAETGRPTHAERPQ